MPVPPESEVEDILLLKVAKSVAERKPFCARVAWLIASVLPLKVSGAETVAEVSAPVPLPVRMPPSVVEPVPPLTAVSALERLRRLMVEEPVTAKLVEVAPAKVAPPLNAICVVVALLGKGYAKLL